MSALRQLGLALRLVATVLFTIATSPFALWTGLFFSLFAVSLLALVVLAGFSRDLLWQLALPGLLLSAVLAFRVGLKSKFTAVEDPKVYDKAKYHYDGDFPKGLPQEQAFVHTGMFVGWLIEHGMIAGDFLPDTNAFKERRLTGAEVYEAWDGSLTSDMLTDQGNQFAAAYFDFERGEFLNDYLEALAKNLPSLYHGADTWENYEVIKVKIEQRYAAWKAEAGKRKGRT